MRAGAVNVVRKSGQDKQSRMNALTVKAFKASMRAKLLTLRGKRRIEYLRAFTFYRIFCKACAPLPTQERKRAILLRDLYVLATFMAQKTERMATPKPAVVRGVLRGLVERIQKAIYRDHVNHIRPAQNARRFVSRASIRTGQRAYHTSKQEDDSGGDSSDPDCPAHPTHPYHLTTVINLNMPRGRLRRLCTICNRAGWPIAAIMPPFDFCSEG